jgi:dihydroorotate dehydrogenase (NAD+) catalytic subunit
MPDLQVAIGSLKLGNPVLVASGTFGCGAEFRRAVPLHRLGGIITKTVTLQPREGNPPPRLVETPSGMLNSVGLQNAGLESFLDTQLPALEGCGTPVIVSVLGETPGEFGALCARLDREALAAGIELNLSCPNVKGQGAGDKGRGGPALPTPHAPRPTPLMVAQDADATAAAVRAARAATGKPLIAKLSPDVTDLAPIARAAERSGADALTIGNTFTGMSLDPGTRRSRLGAMTGGLSGPAIRPLAVYRVWYTARSVSIPIIGLGGIMRAEDAVEFFLAGASAVAVGTATFTDPRAAVKVVRGLERYLDRHGIGSIRELRGALASA